MFDQSFKSCATEVALLNTLSSAEELNAGGTSQNPILKQETGTDSGHAAGSGLQKQPGSIRETITKLRALPESTKLQIKLLFSIALFASLFIFGKVDLSKAFAVARSADYRYLLLAVCLFLSSTFINAYRWKILAGAVGLSLSFLKLAQYCFVGLFFNLFAPSTVGGDFIRCYYVYKGTGSYRGAFYSVLADRAVGISVLFLFASAGLLLGPGGAEMPLRLKLPVYLGTFFVFGVVPFLPLLTRKILGEKNWLAKQFNDSAATIYWQDKGMILLCLTLSVFLQVIIVGCHIAVGLSLGLTQIPLWYYFVFYPSVAVLGFVTPSINGMGIREWAYTYFLMLVGIDNSTAFAYAIMWLGLTTLSSLVGGIVYVAGHFTYSEAEAEELRHHEIE
jgi:uncharacterized membrane protein YbhN (UPF0104 family)